MIAKLSPLLLAAVALCWYIFDLSEMRRLK
jgi:hypothetical protein